MVDAPKKRTLKSLLKLTINVVLIGLGCYKLPHLEYNILITCHTNHKLHMYHHDFSWVMWSTWKDDAACFFLSKRPKD